MKKQIWSLHESVPITVVTSEGTTETVPIKDKSNQLVTVYDTFGAMHHLQVSHQTFEPGYVLLDGLGNTTYVGDSHSLCYRLPNDARWRRKYVRDLGKVEDMLYAHLPQRKTTPLPIELVAAADMDEHERWVLFPESPRRMDKDMQAAAERGVTAFQYRSDDLRVLLDVGRPPCFFSKLLTGRLQGPDFEDVLAELVAGNTVHPVRNFDRFCRDVYETGVIFEGGHITQDIPVAVATRIEKPMPVHHVSAETLDTPFEAGWIMQ